MHDLRGDFGVFHRPERRPTRGRLIYGAIAAALLAAPAFAAQQSGGTGVASNTGAGDASNTGAGRQLLEVVVTATRRAEAISKVPMSVSAMTQSDMDMRGIKSIEDVARFVPGIHIDNTGTNNITIRGIASNGGAGTTGIYIDDTPIQMRALAFNPDEALPETFDLERVEVLRGPQGTLFGAGSEGGTVRYITTPPSLTKTSIYSRSEVDDTQGGAPSYEAGVAAGTPIIDGKLGVRATVWYRYDGGYIDLIDPVTLGTVAHNANSTNSTLLRLDAIWAINDRWQVRPTFYYQSRVENNTDDYWGLYSNPGSDHYVSADPDRREIPDKFYLPSLHITGDFGAFQLIANTAYYHRKETTGYEGTLYNLGFYQEQPNNGGTPIFPLADFLPGTFPLLDANGVHLPPGATNYRAPATIDNGQQNIVEEVRLQSSDPNSRLTWTTGLFFSSNRQTYLEQIHDPLLNELSMALTGQPYTNFFTSYTTGNPVTYDPRFPNDSYFLQTASKDTQYAWYGQATYAFTSQWKLTLGARESRVRYTFNTLTGGPQLFLEPQTGSGAKAENSFTPKVSLAYQYDQNDLYYATYAKGFRPGGANNPVPYAACSADFSNFGIKGAPQTFNSDSVDSYEIGAKNNFDHRVMISSSVFYIRWNNIQQTVVPPICQISFIDNLGTAVAKGVDVQAEIALTAHFTADLSAGYTNARYTNEVRLSAAEAAPIVSSGDAITGESGTGTSGTPSPPVTASIGLQYDFELFAHDSFIRVDDEYQGRSKWATPQQDPGTQQYDPLHYVLSSTNFMSMRAGMRFGAWRFEGFVDNLTDSNTVTNYDWSIDPGTCGATPTAACDGPTRLQTQWVARPRTFGMTAIYRY